MVGVIGAAAVMMRCKFGRQASRIEKSDEEIVPFFFLWWFLFFSVAIAIMQIPHQVMETNGKSMPGTGFLRARLTRLEFVQSGT